MLTEAQLIAPCGMNCGICMAYLRKDKRCPGCHEEDTSKAASCRQCIIKNCEIIKENQVPFEEHLALNMGQLLSIPFVLVGVIVFFIARRSGLKKEHIIPEQ